MSLGENIKIARKKMGMTQEELALQIGVTAQAVSRWESGAGMPDISMVVPLARVLEISTDTLFGYEPEKQYDAYDMEYYRMREQIAKENPDPREEALALVKYACQLVETSPNNYVYCTHMVEACANLSRYVDFDHFATEEWPAYKNKAIIAGTQVIRFCKDRLWVEKSHYALAWIYVHERNFTAARDHVDMLPSISSNRLQEGMRAKLAFFEKGFEGMKPVICNELQLFTGVYNKELIYTMENYAWNADPAEATAFGKWCLSVMNAFAEKKENMPYCRGYLRDLYTFILMADLRAKDYASADAHWKELEDLMQKHYDFHQTILSNPEEMENYDENQLEYMRMYTPEFMQEKKNLVQRRLREWVGEDAVNAWRKA